MKKIFTFIIMLAVVFAAVGCEADIDVKVDGYQNLETKNPSATIEPSSTAFTDGSSAKPNSTPNGDGSEDIPSDMPLKTPVGTAAGSTTAPVPTAPGSSSGSVQEKTASPGSTGTVNSTAKPTLSSSSTATSFPTVAPTEAPVITQGPVNYYILTLDNGGGGGYVYINQGQDGPTNINKGWYAAESYVSVSAVPYEGCTFGGWYVGEDFISPYADYSFYMPARDYPLTAVFIF